jgi:hypothetical protein
MGVHAAAAVRCSTLSGAAQSIAWLQTLGKQMKRVGEEDFWDLVKTTPATNEQREAQFEDYSKFPYQFLSAGPYPPKVSNAEEIYLRVRLKTGSSQGAGTDADIRVSTPDSRNTLLDYMPGANPIIAYDDFEEDDDAVYVLGPFSKVPNHITLKNDAPDTGDVLLAFGKSAVEALALLPKAVLGFAEAIIGTHADHIGTSKKVWTPTDLAAVPTAQQAPAKTIEVKSPFGGVGGLPGAPKGKSPGTQTITVPAGQNFSIDVNGGSEGHYRVTGYIVKTAESPEPGPQGWREFEVRLHELECVKESKWDRGSDSDEPFITAVLSPLPGKDQKALEGPYENVNTGNDPNIKRIFQKVRIPKDVGYLNLPVAVWEHDDEGVSTRRELLNRFAGEVEKETVSAKNGLVSALGGSIAAPWQLRHIEVVAWSRNGQVRVGTVLSKYYNKWIDGGGRANFDLNPAAMKTYPITVNDLLANYSGQMPRPTSDPSSETPQQGESRTSDKGTGNTRPGPILRPRRPRIENPRPGTSGGIYIPRRSGSSAQ